MLSWKNTENVGFFFSLEKASDMIPLEIQYFIISISRVTIITVSIGTDRPEQIV